jgi:hypothetical protein
MPIEDMADCRLFFKSHEPILGAAKSVAHRANESFFE